MARPEALGANFDHWAIFDSGSKQHVSSNQALFSNLRPYSGLPVLGIGNIKLMPQSVGDMTMRVKQNGKLTDLTFQNSLYCPGLNATLISSSQLVMLHGEIYQGEVETIVKFPQKSFTIPFTSGLWMIAIELPGDQPRAMAAHQIQEPWLRLWHERMGHLSEQNLKRLTKMSNGMKPVPEDCVCEACALGKQTEDPHKGKIENGEWPLDLLHTDICGPFKSVPGYDGSLYWLIILDDYTGYAWIFPLKLKSEFFEQVHFFLKTWESPERKCRRIRLDFSGEGNSAEFHDMCRDYGIRLEYSCTDQHEQNGKAEALNWHIRAKLEPTLIAGGIQKKYWPLVVQSIMYLRNRSPNAGRTITPYEGWHGDKPDLSRIRKIGSRGYTLKISGNRKKIADERSTRCTLLGFEGSRIYVVLTTEGKIIRSNNVLFNESTDHVHSTPGDNKCSGAFTQTAGVKRPSPALSANYQRRPGGSQHAAPGGRAVDTVQQAREVNKDPQFESEPRQRRYSAEGPEGFDSSGSFNGSFTPVPNHNDGRLSPSGSSNFFNNDDETGDAVRGENLNCPSLSPMLDSAAGDVHSNIRTRHREPRLYGAAIDGTRKSIRARRPNPKYAFKASTPAVAGEPTTFEQAKASTEYRKWDDAMKEEMKSLEENNTWTAVKPPANRRVLRGKWVYKIKHGASGEITRYKARWVVRGFEQQEGIDYNETFASVVKPMTYKSLFAIVAAKDLELHQMDVKTAFLYGEVDEEIYVELPPGFESGGKVCRLRKALYGLKQSPRIWSKTLEEYLATLNFKPTTSDPSIFCRGDYFLAVYVDDLLIAGPNLQEIQSIKTSLTRRFQMVDLGECKYYLGMTITRDRAKSQLRLGQQAYIERVLKKFNMENCNACKAPMDKAAKLEAMPGDYNPPENVVQRYASLVGSLMYAMLCTRPDIAYSVSVLSRYMTKPGEAHIIAAKKVLRYLKGTTEWELVYEGKHLSLTGYTDADYAGCIDTRRCTAGHVFLLGNAAISWESKRQPTVSLSTTEAEYMGQTQAAKEAIWLRRLLPELGLRMSGPTKVCADNQGAIKLTRNPELHKRTKHIEVRYHFCREKQDSGEIDFQHVSTKDMIADGLTKPLVGQDFFIFRSALGLRGPDSEAR